MTSIDRVLEDLYRIDTFDNNVGIPFNQYLIVDEKPTLIHTGSAPIFQDVLDAMNSVFPAKELAYVFISHFEADECGALTKFQQVAKDLVPVGSAITVRQLRGFGLAANGMAKLPGETLDLGKRRLQFIAYSSEMHLWEGLIAYEEKDKILFTSDLFIRRGQAGEPVVDGKSTEFADIHPMSMPSPEAREAILQAIRKLDVDFMALGHGPVVKITD